jgi:capsular exopolysaccharide synthesis family protein
VRADGPLALLSWDANTVSDEYLVQMRAVADMHREAARLSAVQGPFSANAARLETEAHNLEHQLTTEALTKLGNLKMNVEAASAEVSSLEATFQSARSDYDQFQVASVQLSALERAAAAGRAVYETFVTRWKTTQQAAFNDAQGWLVSKAIAPITPSKPNIAVVVLGSLVLAFGAGLSNAVYREYRGTQTVRSSEDIERHFGAVNLIGMVPELSSGRHRARDVVTASTDGRDQEFSEAARSLYASLKLAMLRNVAGGSVVLVTSALPREGKSSTTGVIASVASAAGQRVVVVDCDLRVPTMHDVLAVELTPGLAGCIEQGLNPREMIRQTKPAGISVLPAGQTRHSPQRLLQSHRFADILSTLRTEFDLILLDTPPVLGLADTRTIARLADYTLLTVCWSATPWKATKLALRTLIESGASAFGLAMTRVDIERLRNLEVPEAETYRRRNRDYYRNYYAASGETFTAAPPEVQGPGA